MLIVDVLMIFIFLERTISQTIDYRMKALKNACEQHVLNENFKPMSEASLPAQLLLDHDDRFLFAKKTLAERKSDGRDSATLILSVNQTLQTRQKSIKKSGTLIGLFFFQHESVIITYPVTKSGKTIAAGGIVFSLKDVYQDFNRIQKIILIFVVVNSLFLALIGNQQLSRIYYRPLKRLAKRAETFRDEDNLFFAVRKEDNEFSVLSSSLNKMLNRIAEDKKVLTDTIRSLKDANFELKKAQNDVIRAEKMATVGRLTSGIAHEIGNPIGIVLGYLDLLKQADLDESERIDFIDRSEDEITRINQIIRQLLDMSRSSAGEAKPVSVHQLIEDLISVFNYQPKAIHITFESSFGAASDRVFADPDRLRQVFLNILLNAVDAVNTLSNDDGCIKITTEPTPSNSDMNEQPHRPSIRVIIEDNGPGLDSSHLPHVFDPFYTTKPPGKGTGLGLSVSFMIVERLGGHISVGSCQNSGAAFQVTLPLFISDQN
jgi:signal transduction histidine kinase